MGRLRKKHPETKATQTLIESSNFVSVNVEGAMNELFTNVSNGKDLVGGAITDVDDSVVIPTDPSFGDLADAIGSISTGKKWASGETKTHLRSTNVYSIFVTGLDFKPAIIITLPKNKISSASYLTTVANMTQYGASEDINYPDFNRPFDAITDNSFMIRVASSVVGEDFVWIAFE